VDVHQVRKIVSGGKFFSVEFIKRTDGQRRLMLARTGVKAGLTGEGGAYDPEKHNLLVVYDVHKKAYRSIPTDSITYLRSGGKTHFGVAPGRLRG
jgi:hypothetical protein